MNRNKIIGQLSRVLLPLIFMIIVYGCGSNGTGGNEPKDDSTAGKKTDTLEITPGDSTEKAAVPVYAIWISKKNDNRSYDGLYDSTSRYIRLCESKQLYHVDDPNEVAINPGNKCFSQGMNLEMITIKKDSGVPLFLTVLDVDSISMNMVGLTDKNDTIVTSISNMNREAFDKLKKDYKATPFKPVDINKIKKYYLPDVKLQNRQKKERIMKANARN